MQSIHWMPNQRKHNAWQGNKQQEQTDLCKSLEHTQLKAAATVHEPSSFRQETIQQQTTNLIIMLESKCSRQTERSRANIEKNQ